jgi:cell fate regulator YaaT (PSP1 superfamily)
MLLTLCLFAGRLDIVGNIEFEKNELSDLDGADPELEALEDDLSEEDAGAAVEGALDGPIPVGIPVYALLLAYSRETLYGIYKGGPLSGGMRVILRTRYGMDMAEVRGEVKREMNPQKIMRIERVATEDDLRRAQKHQEKEKEAFSLCREQIASHGLEMKLLTVHYLHDEQKILFFFSSDNRVDFRGLVKDLVSIFRCRIELRQIVARDESRIGGGFGICGRCYCCSSVSDKLKPVSIKMAKEQNLSLNTAKISGPCGRLLCCLSYEHGFYCSERHNMPNEGCRISMEGELWKVKEVNPICASITLSAEDGRQMQVASNRFVKTDNRWHVDKAAVADKAGAYKGVKNGGGDGKDD